VSLGLLSGKQPDCYQSVECLASCLGATTVKASRHRLIGVCNDRHDRHSGGECEGQGEDYGQLFHDRSPLFIWGSCQNLLGASVTANSRLSAISF
jgi:hypothetical protein